MWRKLIRIGWMECIWILLTGCNVSMENTMRNIEERDYAVVMMIEEGREGKYHYEIIVSKEQTQVDEDTNERRSSFECNNLEELKEAYRGIKGKELSLAHLKILLLSQYTSLNEVCPIVSEFCENREIAKTIPVLFLEAPSELEEYEEKVEQPLGIYLSDLVKTGERQGKNIPRLKDYIKAIREGSEIMIYRLTLEEEGFRLNCANKR